MTVTIIGSASGMPERDKVHTCVAVESNGKMILLDVGEGATSSIVANGIDVSRIEKIFISHTHGDHFIGLPRLLQFMKWMKRKKTLEIFLPERHIDAVEKFLPFLYIFRERFEFDFKFLPLVRDRMNVFESLSIKAIPTGHLRKYEKYASVYGVETVSYAFLVEEGDLETTKKFLFSSDISSVDEISDYLDGVDFLLIECSHVEIEDIIDAVSEADVRKVVLTHIAPEKEIAEMLEYARLKFDIEIQKAYDGMKIEV